MNVHRLFSCTTTKWAFTVPSSSNTAGTCAGTPQQPRRLILRQRPSVQLPNASSNLLILVCRNHFARFIDLLTEASKSGQFMC